VRRAANAFGKLDAIFAPNLTHSKIDAGIPCDYRSLATVEQAAVLFGLPSNQSNYQRLFTGRKQLARLLQIRLRKHIKRISVAPIRNAPQGFL
jgi:hypothetical protein